MMKTKKNLFQLLAGILPYYSIVETMVAGLVQVMFVVGTFPVEKFSQNYEVVAIVKVWVLSGNG